MSYKKSIFTNHASDRMDERVISPFAVSLCATFGTRVAYNTKILNFCDIPENLKNKMKHSLRNRLEHQLPIVVVYDMANAIDENHVRVITAYRYDGQRINKKRTFGTFLTKNSTFKNSYDYRHREY